MRAGFLLTCLVYALFALLLPSAGAVMFFDPDSFWHLAAGDLIRSSGAVPATNPWSLTAPQQPWFNIAWLWDVCASWLFAQGGWAFLVSAGSITLALTVALVFARCLLLSRDAFAAALATLLFTACLLHVSLRPLQISVMGLAALLLLLDALRMQAVHRRAAWAIPAAMMLWANLHGGFLVGLTALGAYALAPLLQRQWRAFARTSSVLLAALPACLVNPYGAGIADGIMLTLTSHAAQIIQEWHPLTLSAGNAPALAFMALVALAFATRRVPLMRTDSLFALLWLLLSWLAVRNLVLFGVAAAPLLACALKGWLAPRSPARPLPPLALRLGSVAAGRAGTLGLPALALAITLGLFSAPAARWYGTDTLNPLPDMREEIDYLNRQPRTLRLLNSYNLGGVLLLAAHGKVPVFMDGRAETAFPRLTVQEYLAFHADTPGWEYIFDEYQLDGVILPRHDTELNARFSDQTRWRTAFKGAVAAVYLRIQPSVKHK